MQNKQKVKVRNQIGMQITSARISSEISFLELCLFPRICVQIQSNNQDKLGNISQLTMGGAFHATEQKREHAFILIVI